ncbi:MAG: phosphotransferase [Clostridia bacterium]|nr:phosphotransferase [Clostridia bacterium]
MNKTDKTNEFTPNEHYPEGAPVPQRGDITALLVSFGIDGADDIKLIDSTHGEDDIRLNYVIDKKWVLRFCCPSAMSETRMGDLNRLIARYLDFGLVCPRFIADWEEKFLHPWDNLVCYLSEYVDLPLASEAELEDEAALLAEVRASVAAFAQRYKGVDLIETMGMYSLFDLSPFDIPVGIDEKQENFNSLIELLQSENETELADKLFKRHEAVRAELKAIYRTLPRCVFQGDENFSNLLIRDGHFAGFIDFNLAGTEVVVNQLVNIADSDYAENRKEPIGALSRLDNAVNGFRESMARMLEYYDASEEERRAAALYAWIVFVAQWPIFCYFKWALKNELRQEILELIALIAELPQEKLTV